MDKRTCFILTMAGVAIVAYSIGYNKAQTKLIEEFGITASKEGMMYLAAQDAIRHRFGH